MFGIKNTFSQLFSDKFDLWLNKRIPAKLFHQLSNRSIFIFPTGLGFGYLFVTLLIFLLGTNYQNNVIVLVSYLMASFFITVMMISFFNFKGIAITGVEQVSGHAEQDLELSITLASANKNKRFDLHLGFKDQPAVRLDVLNEQSTVKLPYIINTRGQHALTRLKVSSEYAFGLFTTWSWLNFGTQALIYPKPKVVQQKFIKLMEGDAEQQSLVNNKPGIDDFNELATYKTGESLARVAWKQLARGQGKFTKHYHQETGSAQWLNFTDMPSASLETKLQHLCYLVLLYHQSDIAFGLSLPNKQLKPQKGSQHVKACLSALALFPVVYQGQGN